MTIINQWVVVDDPARSRRKESEMNLICRIFGHNFKSIQRRLTEEPTETHKVVRTWWSEILCPRCGTLVPMPEDEEEGE